MQTWVAIVVGLTEVKTCLVKPKAVTGSKGFSPGAIRTGQGQTNIFISDFFPFRSVRINFFFFTDIRHQIVGNLLC